MSRNLKIIVSIVGLCLFYLWMSTLFQSCQNKKNANDDIALVNDTLDDESLLDEIDEETFEDEEIDYTDGESTTEDFVSFDDDPVPSNSTTTSNTTNSGYSNSSSTSSGNYLLISGNYLVDTNAEKMRTKLKNMGYANAEIAVFNGSNYQTVIANRYNDYNEALQAASNLKQKGIDCYVKKKS